MDSFCACYTTSDKNTLIVLVLWRAQISVGSSSHQHPSNIVSSKNKDFLSGTTQEYFHLAAFHSCHFNARVDGASPADGSNATTTTMMPTTIKPKRRRQRCTCGQTPLFLNLSGFQRINQKELVCKQKNVLVGYEITHKRTGKATKSHILKYLISVVLGLICSLRVKASLVRQLSFTTQQNQYFEEENWWFRFP